jgi:tetratricopeptide (TPR) repeat protein
MDADAHLLLAETAWDIAQRLPTEDVEGVRTRMGQAADAFDAADEIRPYDVEQLVRASRSLIQMGLLPAAASRLKLANSIEPRNAEVLVVIGDAALAGGQPTGAESAYRQALELDPGLVDVYLNYSAMLAGQERFDEARELLDQGVQRLPDNPRLLDALQKLAEVRSQTTRPASTQPAASPG